MTTANQPVALPKTHTRKRIEGHPADSSWLDRLSVFTSAAFIIGLFVDGWAHNTIPELETFFTPWHAVLYGGFFSVAILMAVTQYRSVGKGYAWAKAMPRGYTLSLVGVVLFFIGAGGDMLWHETFGIEQDLEALFSPTHLLLATGAFLFITGPLRAAWQRVGLRGWRDLFPAILSTTLVFTLFTFFTQYANVFANASILTMPEPYGNSRYFTEVTSVAYIFIPAALMMAALLLLIRRWQLPFGTATVMFGINAFLMYLLRIEFNDDYLLVVIGALVGGLFTDVLIARLRPSVTRHNALRLFTFLAPFVYFLVVLAAIALSNERGLWWEIHTWLGVPFIAGAIGLGLSFLVVPPPIPAET
ncbi:MAG: hypothetical protein LCI00_22470 [Chloroflexi bacterium]|nr:hypothetical protein [Chloroflexota bacterium]MCC6895233.1 hypothetical protein [Anaerolineae bacterium]